MRGTLSIIGFPMIKDDNPLIGKWQYDEGILVRGIFRKEVLNLASVLAEIGIPPEGYSAFVADAHGGNSFLNAGFAAGGNTIVGLIARSAKMKEIKNSILFHAKLKDGRAFLCTTDSKIFNELRGFAGVICQPWK